MAGSAQPLQDPGPAGLATAAAGTTCKCNGYEVVLHHSGSGILPKGMVIGWNVPLRGWWAR